MGYRAEKAYLVGGEWTIDPSDAADDQVAVSGLILVTITDRALQGGYQRKIDVSISHYDLEVAFATSCAGGAQFRPDAPALFLTNGKGRGQATGAVSFALSAPGGTLTIPLQAGDVCGRTN